MMLRQRQTADILVSSGDGIAKPRVSDKLPIFWCQVAMASRSHLEAVIRHVGYDPWRYRDSGTGRQNCLAVGLCATALPAMVPPAPPRFSITIGWPSSIASG